MSKPTKEIIKLAKKLSELRFRQKRKQGDWYIVPEDISITRKEEVYLCADKIPTQRDDLIPIPSISDGVDFLRERRERFFPNLFTEKPWEEMLMAMVKVLESQ